MTKPDEIQQVADLFEQYLAGKINLKQLKVRIENLANEYSPKY